MILTDRQKKLLKIIVEEYTRTANPVGSKTIITRYKLNCSSATIRNDAVVLEQNGLLEKEYASSGRVPSTKGYRYYLDNLMSLPHSISITNDQLVSLFNKRELITDDILSRAVKLISEITHLTTIIVDQDDLSKTTLVRIELIVLNPHQATLLLVTNTGEVQTKNINLQPNILDELKLAVKVFNERLVGLNLNEVQKRLKLLRPVFYNQIQHYEVILKVFVQMLINFQKTEYQAQGYSNMLTNPEFNDVVMIRKVIKMIEQDSPFSFLSSLPGADKSEQQLITVKIGEELNDNLKDIAVITTKLPLSKDNNRTLALVGPKRLEYQKIVKLMTWVVQQLQNNWNEANSNSEANSPPGLNADIEESDSDNQT